jgi:glycosyltransferase involved in cell wall biosynthesis
MTTDVVGGEWQYALDLAQGLRAYDTATTLCVLGPALSPEQRACAKRVPGLELVDVGGPVEWSAETPEQVIDAASRVAAAARVSHATVVHLNAPALAAVEGYPAPVVAVCHSCLATWWHAVRSRPLARERRWHQDLVGRGLRNADAVIAPTAAFASCISQTYNLSRRPVVVYNGRRPSVRSALDNASEVPTSLFAFTAGRLWDEGRRLGVLDAAAACVKIPVVAAGPVRKPNGTPCRFRNLRVLRDVTDGEVAEWLAAKPIFVSTAVYEPFGLAVLEAAEAGCALVLSDIPTYRELWEGAAAFVPLDDAAATAHQITMLAEDEHTRGLLGAAARRRARRYTAEVMAAKVQGVYAQLVASNTPIRRREIAL